VAAVTLVVERTATLDIGKDEVVACLRVPDAAGVGRGRGRRRQEVRTYPTFTSSLETLADWLQTEGVTQAVMEATGQYWRLARRIGKKKAAIAVGHSILVIAWYLLDGDGDYHELGGDFPAA